MKVADLPSFLDQVLERFPLISDLSMMRNPACPGLMDVKRPDMEACRMYRTYVVFRAPQLVTVDGVDVTEEVSFGWVGLLVYLAWERRAVTQIRPCHDRSSVFCCVRQYTHTFVFCLVS